MLANINRYSGIAYIWLSTGLTQFSSFFTTSTGKIKAGLISLGLLNQTIQPVSLLDLPLGVIALTLPKHSTDDFIACFDNVCKTFQNSYSAPEKELILLYKQFSLLLAKNKITDQERKDLKYHYEKLATILFNQKSTQVIFQQAGRMMEKFFRHFYPQDLAELTPFCSHLALERIAQCNIPLFIHFLLTKYKGSLQEQAVFLQNVIKKRFHFDFDLNAASSFCDAIAQQINNMKLYKTHPRPLLHLLLTETFRFENTDTVISFFIADSALLINERECNTEGNTPLIVACKSHQYGYTVIRELLDQGAEIDKSNYLGETPLMNACSYSSIRIVEELLDKGANINLQDRLGQTALLHAGGATQKISLLLGQGADINIADRGGSTPLMDACTSGNIARVSALLTYKPDMNLQDSWGQTALWHLVHTWESNDNKKIQARISILSMLLQGGADINIASNEGRTLLMQACANENISAIKSLLAHNPNVYLKDNAGLDVINFVQQKVDRAEKIKKLIKNHIKKTSYK